MVGITPRIFISYSRTDSAFVDRLEANLQSSGFRTWVDRRKLEGGQDWVDQLQEAIDQCQVILVVLSPEAVQSKYVRMEYRYALSQNKLVIPLEYRPLRTIPIDLHTIQRIIFQNYDQGLQNLLHTLSRFNAPESNPSERDQLSVQGTSPSNVTPPLWRASTPPLTHPRTGINRAEMPNVPPPTATPFVPHLYSKPLLIGLIAVYGASLALFAVGGALSGTPQLSSLPFVVSVLFAIGGLSVIFGVPIAVLILDARGFVTLNGSIKWSRMPFPVRLVVGCLALMLYPYMLIAYFIQAFQTYRQAKARERIQKPPDIAINQQTR